MRLKHRTSLVFIAIALTIAIALPGCEDGGGADGNTVNPYANDVYEPSQGFLEILYGLERAASSAQSGHAVRQARGLSEVERKVINEFCFFTFRMRANGEVHLSHGRPGYAVATIMSYAAYKRSPPFEDLVRAALARLQRIIAPASLSGQELKRYEKACGKLAPFSPTPWAGAHR